MSVNFFEQFGISESDIGLEVGLGTKAEHTAAIMVRYEKVLLEQRSDICQVVGGFAPDDGLLNFRAQVRRAGGLCGS